MCFCVARRNSHRCVRRPGKYGFKPSRENKDGFYAHWEKPWTFGDTPLKILPYGRVFRQHTQQSVTPGGGTVTRVRPRKGACDYSAPPDHHCRGHPSCACAAGAWRGRGWGSRRQKWRGVEVSCGPVITAM